MKAIAGKRYKHYKGNEYVVLYLAKHSETLEELVIYEAQYDSDEFGDKSVWARPRVMFEEKIELNGEQVHRFKVVD